MENKEQPTFEFSEEDQVESDVDFHDFDSSPEVVGVLEAVDKGTYGDQYTLTTQSGEQVIVGTYTALSGKITAEDVGKAVKIECVGEVKSPKSGRNYLNFKVFKKAIDQPEDPTPPKTE